MQLVIDFHSRSWMLKLLMSCTLIINSLAINAQTVTDTANLATLRFQHINSQHGLLQNSITSIHRTAKGMLWIGTKDGIHSYDGTTIIAFNHKPNDLTSLSGNHIADILTDNTGRLWVATLNQGINRFDYQTKRFNRLALPALQQKKLTKLVQIGDSLWIGSQSGLFTLSLSTGDINEYPLSTNQPSHINDLAVSDNGGLIVATQAQGNFLIDKQGVTKLQLPSQLPSQAIHVESTDTIWFAIQHQLWRYNLTTHQAELIWQALNSQNSPDHGKIINDIQTEATGGLWLATSGLGLININPKSIDNAKFYNNTTSIKGSIHSNYLTKLLLDPQGNLWIGDHYFGLYRANVQRQYFTRHVEYRPDQRATDNIILSLLRGKDGTLWVGTDGSGVKSLAPGQSQYR